MALTRKGKQLAKRADRQLYNTGVKIIRARDRQNEMVELGKTVIVTENADGTKTYAFPPRPVEPPTPPRLSWLGGKTYRHGNPQKNLSGHAEEHAEANNEHASRSFADEVTKALAVPAVDGEPVA